jgi:hypothetical protein
VTSESCTPAIELLAIVLNYRTPDLTLACLRSLIAASSEVAGLRVVVVENGSGDGSADPIASVIASEGWGEQVSLQVLPENVGFARGVNHGFRHGPRARFVLLLNSDARLHEGALRYSCAQVAADPSIGAFSCLVENADGSVQNVARRFPTPLRLVVQTLGLPYWLPSLFGWADTDDLGWDRRTSRCDVDWLGGAFLLLRGELVERIGLLDEEFFFYGEDIELCHRIARAGYRCRYDPGATVSHVGAASSDTSEASVRWRRRQLLSARYAVLRKCHGRLAAALVRAVDLIVTSVRARFRALRYGGADPTTRDAQALLALLRSEL